MSQLPRDVDLQGDETAIWLVADDHLADTPIFEITIDEDFYWPAGCSVCGEEATRSVTASFDESQTGRNFALAAAGLAVGSLVVRTGGGSFGSADVPHCDDHDDGVELKSGGVMRMRSHAYYRNFVALNGTADDELAAAVDAA